MGETGQGLNLLIGIASSNNKIEFDWIIRKYLNLCSMATVAKVVVPLSMVRLYLMLRDRLTIC
jgi:D-Tyr-tRNAtyr deacylase